MNNVSVTRQLPDAVVFERDGLKVSISAELCLTRQSWNAGGYVMVTIKPVALTVQQQGSSRSIPI